MSIETYDVVETVESEEDWFFGSSHFPAILPLERIEKRKRSFFPGKHTASTFTFACSMERERYLKVRGWRDWGGEINRAETRVMKKKSMCWRGGRARGTELCA